MSNPTGAESAHDPILAYCDRPNLDQPILVRQGIDFWGWALAPTGIKNVEVFVEGQPCEPLEYGSPRPDVAVNFAEYPNAAHCGFHGTTFLGHLPEGEYTLLLRFHAHDGGCKDLTARFQLQGTFSPILAACNTPDPSVPATVQRHLDIWGWALSRSGIRKVEVFLAEQRRALLEYGGPRPDVAADRPEYPEAGRCGFFGTIPLDDLPEGAHTLHVRITAWDGGVHKLAVPIQKVWAPSPLLAGCDKPNAARPASCDGNLEVWGWALSRAGIEAVEAFIDGQSRGLLEYGLSRPDVLENNLTYPDAEYTGFRGELSLADLAPGAHNLVLRIKSGDGEQTELTAPFRTKPLPVAIRAFLDHPRPDGPPISKQQVRIGGWALSPAGIRDIETLVDGQPRGRLSYGMGRPDVALDHADCPGADHGGFLGTISMEGLEKGEHTLVVRITANDDGQLEFTRTFQVDPTWLRVGEVPDTNAEYQEWLSQHPLDEPMVIRAREWVGQLPYQPTISLIVPLRSRQTEVIPFYSRLAALVESVRAQAYPNWELCLAGDVSLVEGMADLDARIKLASIVADTLRVSGPPLAERVGYNAANAALALATGEFVGLMEAEDVLSPLALAEVVRLLNEAPDTDLVYTDEDKLDDRGQDRPAHWDPFFKPNWSPDLLLSMNYIGQFCVYRRSLLTELGGFRPEYDPSNDYDLLLRFTEQTERIRHIPQILYSRRSDPDSEDRDGRNCPEAVWAAQQALTDALRRRGLTGEVEPRFAPGLWRVRYALRERPGVTLVLLSGGQLTYLRPCLESVLTQTTYPNYQILLIDNSEGNEVRELFERMRPKHPRLHYREFRLKPFDYPALNNFAVQHVETPYLVLLNDDLTILTPDWIETMLEHAQRPEVGIVGAKLLFPDNSIQHGGVVLGVCGNSGHAFKYFPADRAGYFGLPQVVRNCSAVTFACAMMRRSLYEEVGGMDAKLRVAFNDVDFCLKVRQKGYWIVYTPHAVLHHYESVTKKVIIAPGENELMWQRWGEVLGHDPFYNPNLTQRLEDYSLNLEDPPGREAA